MDDFLLLKDCRAASRATAETSYSLNSYAAPFSSSDSAVHSVPSSTDTTSEMPAAASTTTNTSTSRITKISSKVSVGKFISDSSGGRTTQAPEGWLLGACSVAGRTSRKATGTLYYVGKTSLRQQEKAEKIPYRDLEEYAFRKCIPIASLNEWGCGARLRAEGWRFDYYANDGAKLLTRQPGHPRSARNWGRRFTIHPARKSCPTGYGSWAKRERQGWCTSTKASRTSSRSRPAGYPPLASRDAALEQVRGRALRRNREGLYLQAQRRRRRAIRQGGLPPPGRGWIQGPGLGTVGLGAVAGQRPERPVRARPR